MNYAISVLLIVIGNLADYLSTRYALAHGAHEANILVRGLGLELSKIVSAVGIAIVLYFFRNPTDRLLTAAGICLLMLGIAAHNVWVVR